MSKSVVSTSELKARCSEVVSRVERTRAPVTITKRGRPVAVIVPLATAPVNLFGVARGVITVRGDLVAPLDVEWEATR
jgi:prevent-host-death family protein